MRSWILRGSPKVEEELAITNTPSLAARIAPKSSAIPPRRKTPRALHLLENQAMREAAHVKEERTRGHENLTAQSESTYGVDFQTVEEGDLF